MASSMTMPGSHPNCESDATCTDYFSALGR